MRMSTNRSPIHPGEILLEEFVKPHGVSLKEIALRMGLPQDHISDVVNGKKGVDLDLALRLSRLLGTSPELWLNGQMSWDIWNALQGEYAKKLETIEPLATYA